MTQDAALRLSAVWRSVFILSSTIASLPVPVFDRLAERQPARADHPAADLLKSEPNPNMGAFQFREFMQASVMLRGNAYAVIRRDGAGRPRELWPLIPANVEPKVSSAGEIFYRVTLKDGSREDWERENVLHIPGLGFDGISGKSVLAVARETIGLGLAVQKFGAKFFRHGRVAGILQAPGTAVVQPKDKQQLSNDWAATVGSGNWYKVPVLDRGLTYKDIGIPPEDGQFLETRKFTVPDIGRIFGVPPHKLFDLERATFSNIEHQSLEWVSDTIRPYAVRWEVELNRKLFLIPADRSRYYFEHVLEGLLRGDSTARANLYANGRQWGWLTANDIRRWENLPSLGPAGDVFLSPINMVPADQLLVKPGSEPGPGDGDAPADPVDDVRKAATLGLQGLRLRQRIRAAQEKILRAMAERIVNREVLEVGAAAERFLEVKGHRIPAKHGAEAFREWLTQYFDGRASISARESLPAFSGYAELLAAAAWDEIGGVAEDGDLELQRFVSDYAKCFGKRLASGARQEVEGAVGEDLAALLEGWKSGRAAMLASAEASRFGVALAREVFRRGGFGSIWTIGPSACNVCRALDGKPVDEGHPIHEACLGSCEIIPG